MSLKSVLTKLSIYRSMSKAWKILRAFFVRFVFAFTGAICFFLATGFDVRLKIIVLVLMLE